MMTDDLWGKKERFSDELLEKAPYLKLRQAIHELIKTFPVLDVEWTTWCLLNVAAHELASIPDEDRRTVMTADRVKLLVQMTARFADDYRHGNLDDDDDEGE